MNVNILNNLIRATSDIFKMTMNVELKSGKPALVSSPITEEPVCILVGTTGELRGQVVLSFTKEIALDISQRMMMGMGSGVFDELAKSALQEIGNMTMGTFSTLLSQQDIIIDITPPALIEAESIKLSGDKGIKLQLIDDTNSIVVNLTIMLKEN